HTVDRGLQFLRHAALAYFLHDTDDRVPVALLTQMSEFESRAERRTSWKVAISKGFVDYGHRRFRPLIGRVEESAFAQARANSREVITGHHPRECVLRACFGKRLARVGISSRLGDFRQWDSRNRSGVDDAWNRPDLFQLRVDERHTLLE